MQSQANRIAELRRAEGLTQQQLADRLTQEFGRPVDTATLSTYARGKTAVRPDAWLALARILRCPVSWLMGSDSEGRPRLRLIEGGAV